MSRKEIPTLYTGVGMTVRYVHPESMVGGTVYFTVKSENYDTNPTDSSAKLSATVTAFDPDTDGNVGRVASWSFTDDDMNLPPGTYYYDIMFEGADDISYPPIFLGTFRLAGHPTNRNVVNG